MPHNKQKLIGMETIDLSLPATKIGIFTISGHQLRTLIGEEEALFQATLTENGVLRLYINKKVFKHTTVTADATYILFPCGKKDTTAFIEKPDFLDMGVYVEVIRNV